MIDGARSWRLCTVVVLSTRELGDHLDVPLGAEGQDRTDDTGFFSCPPVVRDHPPWWYSARRERPWGSTSAATVRPCPAPLWSELWSPCSLPGPGAEPWERVLTGQTGSQDATRRETIWRVLLVVALLAVSMVGIVGYAWEVSGDRRPARSTPERLLVAGGVSLAAAGVALLVVGTGMDLFMIGLAEGRRAAVGLAYGAFMLTAILGPGRWPCLASSRHRAALRLLGGARRNDRAEVS